MTRLRTQGRRVLFIGGKGGVGKTTTAGALAVSGADAGERVLLVSTDPAHSLGDLFGRRIGGKRTELIPNLQALEIEPDEEVDRYLAGVKQNMRDFVRPSMYPEIERQIELTRHSPGASEAALMQRVAGLMKASPDEHDRVIFDTAPTGHTLRLLALPEIMGAWMDGLLRSRRRSEAFGRALDRLSPGGTKQSADEGHVHDPHGERDEADSLDGGDELSWFQGAEERPPDRQASQIREILLERRRTFAHARRVLLDPEQTAFVMVLNPERLPILETRKALRVLEEHRVPLAGLVVNRVLPESELGPFLEGRKLQEEEYLSDIDDAFARYPRIRVPLLRSDVEGYDALREIGRSLLVAD